MKNINFQFSENIAKKILSNRENAENFLMKFSKLKKINLNFKAISRGKFAGQKKLNFKSSDAVFKKVVEIWDYKIGLKIVREIFQKTEKYKNGKSSDKTMKILISEWEKLNLEKISWPFSQGDFDGFVQRINSEKIDGFEKDKKVKLAAVKYRRIKEINTVRNDFIETLIFEKNKNILPTLNHRRGVDFFIDGISFDQKVAKSPTRQFQKKFGENWKKIAIENPNLVAQFLYQFQDEGRFGADPRLLIVYLDEDISIAKIREIIQKTDLKNSQKISFEFKHKNHGIKKYKVNCFIILLFK